MRKCPHCENYIAHLKYKEVGAIEYAGNIKRDAWYPMQDSARDYYCPQCMTALGRDDLDLLGVPNELR